MGKLVLDFTDSATHLKVYGDWESSGPATNIPTYLADGRLSTCRPRPRCRTA